MNGLDDKAILVTGGASGLGAATATRLVEEGARVLIVDLDGAAAAALAARIGAESTTADVTDLRSVEAAVAHAVARFGGLDAIVNNAGIESARAALHESSLDNWRKVLSVNLDGVFHGMRASLAQFVRQGRGGCIVNISSIAGIVGVGGLSAYAAAKAAVSQLTRVAALEYGQSSIRVNAVAPGSVYTPLLQRMAGEDVDEATVRAGLDGQAPLKGCATCEDIAAAVAFLASDDARYITGVTLPVDGGYTAK